MRYEWETVPMDLMERFLFLFGKGGLSIQQSDEFKEKYIITLFQEKEWPEQIHLLTADREKLELALIEHPDVKGEAWYDMEITYPNKEREIVLKGGVLKMANFNTIPEDKVLENDEQLKFEVESSRSDCHDIMTWYFSAKLVANRLYEDSEEAETVVELNGGMVVPSSTEVEENGFDDLSDFGDSVSGDLWEVCSALADKKNRGLKEKILQEIGEEWIDSCLESFMYIQDISCVDVKYLKKFLRDFDEYKQGLPGIDFCQLVAVLIKWDTEKDKVKAFVDAGWRLLTIGAEECMVAYRGRKITS